MIGACADCSKYMFCDRYIPLCIKCPENDEARNRAKLPNNIATNPAHLLLLTFLGDARKVSAQSGAHPDILSRRGNNPTTQNALRYRHEHHLLATWLARALARFAFG
jgi:hypothetical protein